MLSDLLISSQTTMGLIIAAACIFAVALVLYGVFRKFSQMGWLPWQIAVIFAIMLVTKAIPKGLDPTLRLGVISAIFLIVTALVIGAGEAIRHFALAKMRPASAPVQIADRILGAVTGVLGLTVAIAAVAGFALPLCEHAIPPARDILSSLLFETAFYKGVSGYLFDFFLVAFLVSTVNAGYRVGFGRGLLTILMCVFSIVAFVIAVFMAVGVPGLQGMSTGIANALPGSRVLAVVGGYLISTLIWFVIFFTVFSFFGWLLHLLIRKIRYVRPIGVLGGMLMALIFFILILVVFTSVDAVISWMASGGLRNALSGTNTNLESIESIISSVEEYMRGVESALTSSPLGEALYRGSAIRGLLPS